MEERCNLTPSNVLSKLWKSIAYNYKICFFSGMICGLWAHLYQFTNKLYNFDELDATPYGDVAGLYLSRWSQAFLAAIVKKIFTNTSLPMVNGIIALIFFSFTACIIVKILSVKDCLFSGIIGAICTTTPVVTCTYFYMYMSAYYAFGLFLACVSVYFVKMSNRIRAKRYFFILAAFVLAFSVGIYQAYFPVAVCLALSLLIIEVLDDILEHANSDEILLERKRLFLRYTGKGCVYLLYLILGLAIYFIVNKLALSITNTVLPSYQGMDSIGTIDPKFMVKSFLQAYPRTISLATEEINQLNPTIIVRMGIMCLFICALVSLTMIVYIKKADLQTLLFVLLLLLAYPIALFLVYSMVTPDTFVYTIMLYSTVFAIIMPLVVIERYCLSDIKGPVISVIKNIMTWGVSIAGALITVVFIWYANGNYQALQYTNYHDIVYYSVMVGQIKSIDGYNDKLPVIFLGGSIEDNTNNAGSLIEKRFNLAGKDVSNVNQYSSINIITQYIGFTPEFLWSDEEQEHFYGNAEVLNMPCYPADGSIRIIDDVIVVKTGELPLYE